ncbi:MAG: DUF4124 domain-containing protein [Lautropia sp.]
MTLDHLRCARSRRAHSRPAAAGLAAALVAVVLNAGPAHAQYQWVDPAGQMVYSDLPPPPGTDPSKVLRRPKPQTAANGAASAAPSAPDAARPKVASVADRELAFRKRMQERADAERKKAEEGIEKAKTAKACDDARSNLRQLESGIPLTRIRADGQRDVLSDDERGERMNALRKDLAGRC